LGLVCWLLLAWPALAGAQAGFPEAQAAFAAGDFQSAFNLFQRLVQESPGDPELDFLLARSAFEIGDYETAIFAFERVLIAQPEADRSRLELGRSFFELGEFESARASFQQVLDHHPPANVSANIHRYLQLIDRKTRPHQLSGLLALGLSYDDNIHSSPIDEQIQTLLGNLTLSGSGATPQEDIISQNSLALNHLYRQHPQRPGWLSALLLYNASYFDEGSLNLNLVGFTSGPLWQNEAGQGRLQGTFHYLSLDDERYLTTAGLEFEQSWRVGAACSVGLLGALTRLNYAADERDARQARLVVRPVWSWGGNRLGGDLGGEWSSARDGQYSYRRALLRLGYQRQLPWRLTINLGGRLQVSDYLGEAPLFGKKRHDVLREANLDLSRVLWQEQRGGGQLRAEVSYVLTATASNIDLYEYDKQVLSFALSYLF
jgi:tetratricopeptide (TPR) repeat protein